jgi:pyrroloquinoline quinone (PQQ) biosynthesis protein C
LIAPPELVRLRGEWNVAEIPTLPANPDMKPALTGVCTYAAIDGEVPCVESARRVTEIEDVEDRRILARLLPECIGQRTVRELGPIVAVAEGRLAEIVATLYELGVVRDAASLPIGGVAFNRHLSSLASPTYFTLAQRVGLHARLVASPPRRLLLGWLVESHLFIRAAAEYLSVAVSTAPSDRTRMLVSDYLSSEFWHGAWVREGLLAAGLTAATLDEASPLPGTLAVINALRTLAATDFHAFAAVLCLHESPAIEGAGEAVADFWAAVSASGALPDAALAPFREHHLIDCAEAHGSIAEQLFLEKSLVSGEEQRRITRAVLAHAHTLAAWFRQTLDFYAEPEGPAVFTVAAALGAPPPASA